MDTSLKRILVATDFSPTAEHAQRLAHRLAASFGAEIHLLHVRLLLEDPHLGEAQHAHFGEMLAASDADTRDALATSGSAAVGLRTISHVVRGLSPAEAIVESAMSLECDLVVMGTHGRRGLTHALLGSVAERVIRAAPMPVLTVRLDAVEPESIRRILVPYDFSDHSRQALAVATTWATSLGADLTLLHAVEPVVYPDFYAVDVMPGELTKRLLERSRTALSEIAAEHPVEGTEPTVQVVAARAADAVLAAATPDACDLVVMGTRGLSGLEHLLLGSVAESVARRCPVPVLAVREI
jgi:nucleotide-binding universal stress UspA family protein